MRHVVIVGAGPAGMAAALRASQSGARVSLIDENPKLGGQIWRQGPSPQNQPKAAGWWFKHLARGENIQFYPGTTALESQKGALQLYSEVNGRQSLPYDKLILATGARELFLPFPGWTTPGVTGVGGLQALVKSGLSVRDKKIIVAGTGPLLLAAAAAFKKAGAKIALIAEQTSQRQLLKFSQRLLRSPGKLKQAMSLRLKTYQSPYMTDAWVEEALGDDQLKEVIVRQRKTVKRIACDFLAVGFGLIPNVELPGIHGCELAPHGVFTTELGLSSKDSIYCPGEVAGIGGVDLGLLEGEIAGFEAAGESVQAAQLVSQRNKEHRFRRLLREAFELRQEVKSLGRTDTVICRCEDVRLEDLSKFKELRAAKLSTRMAMGPCQGRVCGPIGGVLFGWSNNVPRPPLCPIPVKALCSPVQIIT
jgi:D-hydroxyproline dehydrogenase subunit alpha